MTFTRNASKWLTAGLIAVGFAGATALTAAPAHAQRLSIGIGVPAPDYYVDAYGYRHYRPYRYVPPPAYDPYYPAPRPYYWHGPYRYYSPYAYPYSYRYYPRW